MSIVKWLDTNNYFFDTHMLTIQACFGCITTVLEVALQVRNIFLRRISVVPSQSLFASKRPRAFTVDACGNGFSSISTLMGVLASAWVPLHIFTRL